MLDRRRFDPLLRPWYQRLWRLTRGMTLGVRALVTDEAGRVLLIEHTYVCGWNLPGGGVDRGETAEQAVVRELFEETGLEARSRPRLLSAHSNEAHFRGDHVLLYRIDTWEQISRPRAAEISRCEFFAPDALPDGLRPGAHRRIQEMLACSEAGPMW